MSTGQRVMRVNKTKQDKMPVDERPRVKEWQQRLEKMRKPNG